MRFCFFLLFLITVATSSFSQSGPAEWLAVVKTAGEDSTKLSAFGKLYNYYQFSNPDSAAYFANQSLQYFKERKYKQGIATANYQLGVLDGIHGQLELAKQRHATALQLFTEVNDRRGIALVNNAMGVLLGRTGNLEGAMRHFMTALKEYEQINDATGVVSSYMKLGVVLEKSDNLDGALEYYTKALNKLETMPADETQLLYLYNNIGIVYGKKGEIPKAKEYFERALKRSSKPDLLELKILSLTNLGIIYNKMGDDKQALAFLEEASDLTKSRHLPENYARLAINIASILEKTDREGALDRLRDALSIVKSTGQKSLEAEVLNAMEDVYMLKNDYKTALELSKKQKALLDTLFSLDKAKEIANIQSVYELKQSNAKVDMLEQAARKSALRKNIIIGVTGCLAVILALLIRLFIKSRRLNETLRAREAELKRTNEVKDKIFSIIGHDLRGPVGSIPMMLELLNDGTAENEETRQVYSMLTEQSKASMDTLEKLLYWGQAQIKGSGLKQIRVDTREYIENNLKLIKSSAEQKHISVVNEVPAGIMVYADAAHFDFIFRNLLSNAIKFTYERGEVHITADVNSKPGFVVFAVHDSGMGIEQSKVKDIFKAFGNSTPGTANEKGTSIGLMLCHEFVTENGGQIWVESELGKGSVFFFSLPAA